MAVSKVSLLVVLVAAAVYMASAGPVVKRSDDSNPLQAVLDTHSMELSQLKTQLQASETRIQVLKGFLDKRAAFRAILNKAVAANAPIKFDQSYSLGGGYDQQTGIYTVPISGVYSFQLQLYPKVPSSFHTDLYLNGHIVIRSRSYDRTSYPTSCYSSSIFHVSKGDKVWVQSTAAGTYYPDVHSFFSGVLESPDP